MIKRLKNKNIPTKFYLLALVGLVLVRLLVAYSQRVFLLPEGSAIDDMLMVRAAKALVEGDWMGGYGGMAIAKNMGFALWVAGLHTLGIPFLLGNAGLWLLACGCGVVALKPVFPGNVGRLVLFGFFAFYPISFAFFNQRVYRDAIFPALGMFLFSGVVGMALRGKQKWGKGFALFAILAGAGLGAGWLVREDGILLLAFALCGLLALLLFVWWGKAPNPKKKTGFSLGVFAIFGVAILGFSAANSFFYSVFLVNDLNSGSFPKAYGAMVAVSQAESGFIAKRPVTKKALEAMYKEAPTLALLQEELEHGPLINGFGSGEPGEFEGSFYFALRLAAEYTGHLPNAPAAQAFWAQIEREIRQAVEAGRLQSVEPTATTIPRWSWQLLPPALAKTLTGGWAMLILQDCDPRPLPSIGTPEGIEEVAQFVHSPVQTAFVEGTDQPYYNWGQRILFGLCDVLIWVYRLSMLPLFCFGVVSMVKCCHKGIKNWKQNKKPQEELLWGILLLGLLLSVLLRFFVAAYMDVAAFGIGMYIMYLSGAGAPLLLFTAWGVGCLGKQEEGTV